ncbi:uncharacterized protein LOC108670251 [Hyalella azteca]|uniref:Uncharacterized protein LOC108670251 n=1 Tax=Hyalella azteca TaxID=294128 RepID=A0A8B7NHT6_HYAAZ|nr:uncharacterized protein LOC108670251 [Hyalella azteca]
MQGVRSLEPQGLSGVWCHSIKEASICVLLGHYHSMLRRLHGRQAGTLLLQHSGGIHSYINSASDFVKNVQPFHPCLKFINALMEAQVSAYGSHGLYCGLLCSSLLQELLKLVSNGLPLVIIQEISGALVDIILSHCSEPTAVLDVSSIHEMMKFLGPCLTDRNLGLNDAEIDHLKTKVLEAVLLSISDIGHSQTFGDVVITEVPGRPVTEASVFKGLLYRHHRLQENSMACIISNLESFSSSHIVGHKQASSSIGSSSRGINLLNNEENNIFSRIPNGIKSDRISFYTHNRVSDEAESRSISLILFNITLEFSSNANECIKFCGKFSSSTMYDMEVTKQLTTFMEREKILILACQKVVSESITAALERRGILVLERLGTALTTSLEKLANCRAVSDLQLLQASNDQPCMGSGHQECKCLLRNSIGAITGIKRRDVSGRLYLLIENTSDVPHPPVVTLLLPALMAPVAANLKVLVEEAVKSVSHSILSPGVVCGFCWGANLAALVQRRHTNSCLLQRTGATEAQVFFVVEAFWRVFVRLQAQEDGSQSSVAPLPPWATDQHRQEPPQSVPQERKTRAAACHDETLSHAAVFSAVSSALETVLQLLQVDYCIFDR